MRQFGLRPVCFALNLEVVRSQFSRALDLVFVYFAYPLQQEQQVRQQAATAGKHFSFHDRMLAVISTFYQALYYWRHCTSPI